MTTINLLHGSLTQTKFFLRNRAISIKEMIPIIVTISRCWVPNKQGFYAERLYSELNFFIGLISINNTFNELEDIL